MDARRQSPTQPLPHVLIFPLPFQGPVNCMLKLADLLCSSGDISITFLNTDHVHRCLLRHTQILRRLSARPNFRSATVSDGLPINHPRSGDSFMEVMASMDAVAVPLFREMLVSGELSSRSDSPVTVLIADGFYGFALDVAGEAGVPCLYFETISPCGLWTYLCAPKLIEDGEFPFQGKDLDGLVKGVPGTEDFLRRRDLPSLFRSDSVAAPFGQLILREAEHVPRAKGLILNTFEAIETVVLPRMLEVCPNIFCIGPIHALHRARVPVGPGRADVSSHLWEADGSCIEWLDGQPSKSVVYVSIGSLASMTVDQLIEFWYGLVNSGKRFLWVRRPGSITGKYEGGGIPDELAEATKQRGHIVEWAPQEEVLAHPAVSAFLTHSGWNSTLESMVEGVQMVCWPYFADQQVNSRFVSEVWRIGLDMKDTCDRVIIENAVREIMDGRREEFEISGHALKKLAAESVSRGGSSSVNLDRLIEEIKSQSLQALF